MRRASGLLPLGGLLAAVSIVQPTTASAQPAPTTYPHPRPLTTPVHAASLMADVNLVGSLSDIDWTKVRTIPEVAITAIPAAGPLTVTAAPGDTVSALATKYGVTVAQLGRSNNMADPDVLAVGQVLTIPSTTYQAAPYPPPPPPVVVVAAVAPVAAPAVAVTTYVPHVATYTAPTVYQAPAVAYQAPAYQAPAYVAPAAPSAAPGGVWGCIAQHESGGNPAENTGNGFWGMYQFTLGTWAAYGGVGNPANASASEQLAVAQRVQQGQGWGAWPQTSQICGA